MGRGWSQGRCHWRAARQPQCIAAARCAVGGALREPDQAAPGKCHTCFMSDQKIFLSPELALESQGSS